MVIARYHTGAQAGILRGSIILRKNLGHTHFYSFYGNSDHGYGTWSSSGVHYFESGDDKTRLSCSWSMEADGRQAYMKWVLLTSLSKGGFTQTPPAYAPDFNTSPGSKNVSALPACTCTCVLNEISWGNTDVHDDDVHVYVTVHLWVCVCVCKHLHCVYTVEPKRIIWLSGFN